jgi:hypothetical protein
MTSSYIEKVGVWDPRLVQEEPTYLVQKGALSNTVMPFQAISANTAQHTYQLQVPNLGVFTARDIRWRSGVFLTFNCKYAGLPDQGTVGSSVAGATIASVAAPAVTVGLPGKYTYTSNLKTMCLPGKDICLSMFPLQSLCTNMQISINDANVTTNGDTLREMLLLSNVPTVRKLRTTPTKFDVYANCRADAGDGTSNYPGAINGNFQTFLEATEAAVPNGAWPVTFYAPVLTTGDPAGVGPAFANVAAGQPLVGNGTYVDPGNGRTVRYMNGVPCWGLFTTDSCVPFAGGAAVVGAAQTITDAIGFRVHMRFDVTEPIAVSPFLWRETSEMSSVGLFGCTNMQFTMNLQAPSSAQTVAIAAPVAGSPYWSDLPVTFPGSAQIIKCSGVNTVIDSVAISAPPGQSAQYNGFVTPSIFAQFLTPAPGISVPLISSVPYTDFPRYFSNLNTNLNSGTNTFSSQTITLSSCPDIVLIWVKPNLIGSTKNIPYVPITRASITFDNFSNLCSNFTAQHLYACTTAAGVDMPWLSWAGYASTSRNTNNMGSGGWGAPNMLVGGPLALRVGTDITLSPGLAPGCLGNYSMQVTVDLDNSQGFFNTTAPTGLFPATGYTMTIMPISSGMFETCQGSSTIRRTILNTSDVISVTTANSITTAHLHRLVGGGHGHFGTAVHAKLMGGGPSGGALRMSVKRPRDCDDMRMSGL